MPKEFIQSINNLEPQVTTEDMQKLYDSFMAFCAQPAPEMVA